MKKFRNSVGLENENLRRGAKLNKMVNSDQMSPRIQPYKVDHMATKSEQNHTNLGTNHTKFEPNRSKLDLAPTKLDLVTTKLDPTTTKLDPATTKLYPATTKLDPATVKLDPASAKLDPKSSKLTQPSSPRPRRIMTPGSGTLSGARPSRNGAGLRANSPMAKLKSAER